MSTTVYSRPISEGNNNLTRILNGIRKLRFIFLWNWIPIFMHWRIGCRNGLQLSRIIWGGFCKFLLFEVLVKANLFDFDFLAFQFHFLWSLQIAIQNYGPISLLKHLNSFYKRWFPFIVSLDLDSSLIKRSNRKFSRRLLWFKRIFISVTQWCIRVFLTIYLFKVQSGCFTHHRFSLPSFNCWNVIRSFWRW